MHRSFLPYLADPHTKESLTLVTHRGQGDFIIEGELRSSVGTYPIRKGIPRLVPSLEDGSYVRSFSYQWGKWSRVQFESENQGGPMQGHTERMWQKITAIQQRDLEGAVLLDYGCGSGRFMETVRKRNGRVIGLDLSNSVESARQNFIDDPGVLVCQADALTSPIKPNSVDAAYSIGVLHHTPNPFQGFQEMVKTVKPGGRVSLAVYSKGGYYDSLTVRMYRGLFRALQPFFGPYLCLAYSYAAAYALRPLSRIPLLSSAVRAVFPFVPLPDVRWAVLDTFDSLTPVYQSTHESYEVYQWFKRCGLQDIEPSEWGSTAFHATRP